MIDARPAFRPPLLPDGSDGLRLEVRKFLREQAFEPRCGSWLSGFDPGFSRRLAARGWVGMTWPARYGGGERTPLDRHVVAEELLAAGAPVAAHWISDRLIGPLLLRHGGEEQRERLLPAMARGECFFCVGMSEPGAHPSARCSDGGFLVSGEVGASNAHRAHYLLTLVRTERQEGLSHVMVDLGSPGVDIRPSRPPHGDGRRGGIVLRDVFLPETMLVGREGEGPSQALMDLPFASGGPERFLSTFPLLRQAIEVGLAGDARAADAIGRLTARLWALRRLALSVAGAVEAGESPAAQAALVAELGTRFERDVVETVRGLAQPITGGRLAELLFQAVPAAGLTGE